MFDYYDVIGILNIYGKDVLLSILKDKEVSK